MRMPFHVDLKKGCLHSLKCTNLVHVEPFPHWLEHIHKRTQKQTDAHRQTRKRHLSFHPFLLKSETEQI